MKNTSLSQISIILLTVAICTSGTVAFSSHDTAFLNRHHNQQEPLMASKSFASSSILSSVGPPSSTNRQRQLNPFHSNKYKSSQLRRLDVHTRLFAGTAEQHEEKLGKGGKSDDVEWNALVGSFKMYKAAYGDLKVPSRFVVPSMPPWPGQLLFYIA